MRARTAIGIKRRDNFYTALLLYVAQYPGLKEARDLVTAHRLLNLAWNYENEAGESLEKRCAQMVKWTDGPKGRNRARQCRSGWAHPAGRTASSPVLPTSFRVRPSDGQSGNCHPRCR
jgi:hypothetical protein